MKIGQGLGWQPLGQRLAQGVHAHFWGQGFDDVALEVGHWFGGERLRGGGRGGPRLGQRVAELGLRVALAPVGLIKRI